MRILVVHAHPAGDSFVAHLRNVAVGALTANGHQVDVADLYREGFDPLDGDGDGDEPAPGGPIDTIVADQRTRLGRADGLILVHPTWWGGHPAILKGWLDRVLTDRGPTGRRAGHGHGGSPPGRSWPQVRRLATVTTHGSPHWINRLQGEPGRCTTRRALRAVVHPAARCQWLACYGLDRLEEGQRARFARRVERTLGRW